jgi:hypothetical protein
MEQPVRNHDGMRRDLAPVDLAIAEIATRQGGAVADWHLLALGLSRRAIERRVRAGRLVRKYQGVYAVGHGALTSQGKALAAVWACGPDALLSHQAAGREWDILSSSRAVWDVTLPRTGGLPRRKGIAVHRAHLHPYDRAVHNGIPITSVARTLLDCAAVLVPRRLKRMIEAADRAGLLDLREIEPLLERSRGHRGRSRLMEALGLYRGPPPLTRSELERRFYEELCGKADLPRPSMNPSVEGFEVDAFWPDRKLIVEIDTYATHGDRASFERDRERDLELGDLGYEVIRITDRMIHLEPAKVVRRLRRKVL